LYTHRNIHPNAIRGALSSLVLDWGVPVIFVKDSKETAALLEVISKREFDKGRSPSIQRPKATTVSEYQELLVSSLPGINLVLARRLLEVFGTPIELMNASVFDLITIEGIGEKKANKIKKILQTKYSAADNL